MSWGAVLQTIGIIFMASGSILAIEGLRKRLKKAKKQALLDYAKVGLVDSFFDLMEDSMQRLVRQGKIETNEENELKSFVLYVCFKLYSALLMGYLALKHSILKSLEEHCIRIGIYFIIIGMILQIVSLWL